MLIDYESVAKYNYPIRVERYAQKNYYIITNETYCQLFWIRLMLTTGIHKFANQQMITSINNFRLTDKVMIDCKTMELFRAQNSINAINFYYNAANKSYINHFEIPQSAGLILIVAIISIIIVVLFEMFVYKKNIW